MNNRIFFFFYNFAHQSNVFDNIVVFFAVYFPYIVVILAGLILFFYQKKNISKEIKFFSWARWKEMVIVFAVSAFARFLALILKDFFHQLRPFDAFTQVHSLFVETGYSFPSGHATSFAALAFAIFFNHKKAGYVFMIFALIIGIARIIAGVHFPIDILGGFILGTIVAVSVKYLKP
jgi:undecaprenyl-diphosphatase